MMKTFRLSLTLGAALLALAAAPGMKAEGFNNHETTVTFSGPVDIAGTTLSAGTYVFRTPSEDRNLVEIMNSDETELVAMVRAFPAQAAEPSGNTRIELNETQAGAPEMVHEWFYPGETIGWEFPAPARTTAAIRPGD